MANVSKYDLRDVRDANGEWQACWVRRDGKPMTARDIPLTHANYSEPVRVRRADGEGEEQVMERIEAYDKVQSGEWLQWELNEEGPTEAPCLGAGGGWPTCIGSEAEEADDVN